MSFLKDSIDGALQSSFGRKFQRGGAATLKALSYGWGSQHLRLCVWVEQVTQVLRDQGFKGFVSEKKELVRMILYKETLRL